MGRSLSFGCTALRLCRPVRTRFRYGSAHRLTLPQTSNSPARYAKSTRSSHEELPPLVGTRFQVLFHSPSGVLFTFPSRYLSAIGHQGVLSLGGWSPQFQSAFHGRGLTQERMTGGRAVSSTGRLPLYACAVPHASTTTRLCNLPSRTRLGTYALQPPPDNACPLTSGTVSRLIPFRSPLLRESRLIFFPRGTEMFHFPRLSSPGLCVQPGIAPHYQRWVSPFSGIHGSMAIQRLTVAYMAPFTPFFDSWCQGIHRVPLLS